MAEGNDIENSIWTCRDIASNASNWTLACDVQLLRHLEAFSDRILESSRQTNDRVDDVLKRLDETALSLDLARNNFASLSNTQFIESRIYEEDETVNEGKLDQTITDSIKNDESTKDELKTAALRGLAVIQKHFDRVEVPESDSEDENVPNFVLRAKDPYMHRPLPYVIGTDEWYKSSTAGVLDSSSDSDDERESEKYSDDSELKDEELPDVNDKMNITRSVTESETSEGELVNKLEKPLANSTFNDTNRNGDYLESVTQHNSTITQSCFAEQLARKLGNVINANVPGDNVVNTRPIQKQQSSYATLFSNEPPPVDANDVFDNRKSQGIFSGGDGLFDDLEDDVSFWGEQSTSKKPESPLKEEVVVRSENKTKNDVSLFDSTTLSDEELFTNKPLSNENANPKPTKEMEKSKKLNLFDDTSQSSEDDDPDMFTKKEETSIKKRNLNLFGEDSDNSDDLFATKPVREPPKLFDKTDIFNNNDVSPKIVSKKVPNLFSDSDSDDLFSGDAASKPKIISVNKPEKVPVHQSDDDKIESQNEVLFEPSYIFEEIPSTENIFDDVSPPGEENDEKDETRDGTGETTEPRLSIFDNEPPSLFYNESSGIVRDLVTTRVEDVSSFYPYASSSRKLSADTFGVYSEDNLFLTKPPEDNRDVSIDENVQNGKEEMISSYVDLTPSGKASEVYSESTENPSRPRKVTFGSDVKVFEDLKDDTETDGSIFSVAEENNPVDSQKDIKIDKEKTKDGNEEILKETEEKTSPGKLKHNLDIDVRALLPGGTPMRKGFPKPERPASMANFPNYDNAQTERIPTVLRSLKSLEEAKGDNVEVLQSITKTRARIPNRKPSTRRGREAFRKSRIDVTNPAKDYESSEEEVVFDDRNSVTNRLNVSEITKTSFVKSDNFATPEFNKPDLFENDNDDDLFSEKKLPPKSTILKRNLFDDDDDDIDFFQKISQPKKTIPTHNTDRLNKSVIKKTAATTIVKKLENIQVTEDDPLNAFDR